MYLSVIVLWLRGNMNMVNGILNQENIELKYILDERQLKAVQEHS